MLSDPKDWPLYPPTGKPLLLVASIVGDFLTPEFPTLLVPTGFCLSVFCVFDPNDFDTTVSLMVHDDQDFPNLASGGRMVLLHKASAQPCAAPADAPPTIPMKKMSLQLIPDGDHNFKQPDTGDIHCKVGGKGGWGQEPVQLDGMHYVLQLTETALGGGKHAHNGLFEGGVAFLFLKDPMSLGETGTFFIQFT